MERRFCGLSPNEKMSVVENIGIEHNVKEIADRILQVLAEAGEDYRKAAKYRMVQAVIKIAGEIIMEGKGLKSFKRGWKK